MMISFGNKRERLPIVIIDCYIGITIFLYFCGPIRFHSPYSPRMLAYTLLFLVIINLAYFRAIWKINRKEKIYSQFTEDNTGNAFVLNPLPLWFYFLGMLIPLIMFLSAMKLTGGIGLNTKLFNIMAQSYTFIQSGGRYQEGLDVAMWIYMHFAVFVYLTIIDGLLFFKKNNAIKKLLWALSIMLLIAYFVLFRGAQKTLGDVFILCTSAMLIKSSCIKSKQQKKNNKKGLVLLIIMAIMFATILATIMGSRISYLNDIGYDGFKLHTKFWDVDLNNFLLALLPEKSKIGFACLIFYLCNGLCGLSYCLACPIITWTYGLGTFPDLGDILRRRLGIDVYQDTYMYEAYEIYGWHHSELWHSLFPYLASDWTFIGTLLIMAGVAYIYATCWIEVLRQKNKASIYMFSLLNIIWIYLPCNNQIFATRTTSLVFIVCFVMWIRRKKNGYNESNRIK